MRFLIPLLLVLCLCPAAAEETVQIGTVQIGKVSINFVNPEGFRRADALFPVDIAATDNKFGLNTIIFAKFIPEEAFAVRETDARAVPSWYIHLAHDKYFYEHGINKPVFRSITYLTDKILARQYKNADFIQTLETVIAGALRRRITLHSMTQKGFVEKKPEWRSMLACGYGKLETETGTEDFSIATLTTLYLIQGKLIIILQAGRIQSEKDLPAFTGKALRLTAEIADRKTPSRLP
jgi:hypothetical protein